KNPEDRIFKVVFVGNSGVGKSSFIHRFCHDRFLTDLNATIGIDYQVKNLMVDNTQVALQLWDTAGQERFRSITKQYFRKADGILVMYDITAECSFTAVRNWMSSVQVRAGQLSNAASSASPPGATFLEAPRWVPDAVGTAWQPWEQAPRQATLGPSAA
uniref:Uncharacterized protein n=1 Tax=Nothoprocta perdicaria TaxID=30464 RepID=A0A8C6YND2_NOTPE